MNETPPFFSVIIPCYNHGMFVSTAIESVLNQTYKNFEILVADNGSTDNSWDVIRQYSSATRIFQIEKNDMFGCLIMLAGHARGEYICQMAADDYWEPNKLEEQAKLIAEHPDGIGYFTRAIFTDEDLNPIDDDRWFKIKKYDRYESIRQSFDFGTILPIMTLAMLKKYYIDLMFGNICQYRQLTDQKEIINILRKGEVYVSDECCMKIRRSKNQISSACDEKVGVRACNETASIWGDLWEDFTDEEFVSIFKNDLINPDIEDAVDVMCERMLVFLKLTENRTMLQDRANEFFARHYNDIGVSERLESKYNYTCYDFHERTGETGYFSYIRKMQDVIEDYKKITSTINEKLDLGQNIKLLYELNDKIYSHIGEIKNIDSYANESLNVYIEAMNKIIKDDFKLQNVNIISGILTKNNTYNTNDAEEICSALADDQILFFSELLSMF